MFTHVFFMEEGKVGASETDESGERKRDGRIVSEYREFESIYKT